MGHNLLSRLKGGRRSAEFWIDTMDDLVLGIYFPVFGRRLESSFNEINFLLTTFHIERLTKMIPNDSSESLSRIVRSEKFKEFYEKEQPVLKNSFKKTMETRTDISRYSTRFDEFRIMTMDYELKMTKFIKNNIYEIMEIGINSHNDHIRKYDNIDFNTDAYLVAQSVPFANSSFIADQIRSLYNDEFGTKDYVIHFIMSKIPILNKEYISVFRIVKLYMEEIHITSQSNDKTQSMVQKLKFNDAEQYMLTEKYKRSEKLIKKHHKEIIKYADEYRSILNGYSNI